MELGSALPAELLSSVAPLGRGPPDVLRPRGRDADANAALAPFQWLLQMLGNPLPGELPGGETLPIEGGSAPPADEIGPESDALAALAGAAAPGAPAQPSPSPAAASVGPAPVAASSPTNLADAMRLAFAAGLRPADASAAAADASSGGPSDAAADTDSSGVASSPTPATPELPVARSERSVELAAPSMADLAARAAAEPAAAEPRALSPRSASEGRVRAASGTPAERALALAADLVRADQAQTRTEGPSPRALDGQAPLAVTATPEFLKTAKLEQLPPLKVDAPIASFDSAAAPPPPALHGPGGTPAAQPNAQLPAQLGSPVDTNAARWEDALANRIQWLVDHKIGEAQIKLNPPELGALDVKISLLDDKTYVQMTAHTPTARDELSQSLPRLRELMSAGGLDLGGATVSGGQDDRSGYQAATEPLGRVLPMAPEPVEVAPSLLPGRLSPVSRIDIFA